MSKLKKNVVYNLAGQSFVLLLSFASIKYIHHDLGPDVLGLIFFTALVNLLLADILQTGVSITTVREIASNYHCDKPYVKDYIKTATTVYWSIYFLVVLFIYFLSPFLVDHWVVLESLDRSTAINIVRVLGVSSMIILPRWLYVSLLRGMEQMGVTNLIDVLATALQHLVTILLIINDQALMVIIYWLAISYVLRALVYIFVAAVFFDYRMLIPGFKLYVIKKNIRFTSTLTFATILKACLQQLDKIIISKLMLIASVGYYGVLFGALSKTRLVTGAIIHAAFPSLSRMSDQHEHDDMVALYDKILDISALVVIFILALVAFISELGLTFIFNHEIALNLVAPTMILCFSMYINTITTLPNIIALAVGNSGIGAKQNILDLIIYPPICVCFILEFNLIGASAAFLCYGISQLAYSARRTYKECIKKSYFNFIKRQLLLLATALVIYGMAWLLIHHFKGMLDINLVLLNYLIASGVFAAAYFLLFDQGLSSDIAGYYKKYIN